MNLRAALKKNRWSGASLTTDVLIVHVVKRWSYRTRQPAGWQRRGRWQEQYEVTGLAPRTDAVLWQGVCADLSEIVQYLTKVVPTQSERLLDSEGWN